MDITQNGAGHAQLNIISIVIALIKSMFLLKIRSTMAFPNA